MDLRVSIRTLNTNHNSNKIDVTTEKLTNPGAGPGFLDREFIWINNMGFSYAGLITCTFFLTIP